MGYVYRQTEKTLWTVGYYSLNQWVPESDHDNRQDAAARVAYLNGNGPQFPKAPSLETELGFELREAIGNLAERFMTAKEWPKTSRLPSYDVVKAVRETAVGTTFDFIRELIEFVTFEAMYPGKDLNQRRYIYLVRRLAKTIPFRDFPRKCPKKAVTFVPYEKIDRLVFDVLDKD